VSGGTHQLVDIEDAAVGADVERPSGWKRLIRIDHAVSRRDALVGITQERIVDAKRLPERLVRLRRVDADGKVRDFEGANLVATLTE
jgi:hypothetical protein